MNRSRTTRNQNLPGSSKRTSQPKPGAWSVQKSSTVRLGPQSILKTVRVPRPDTAPSGTSVRKARPIRDNPSVLLGKLKENLELDTQQFNYKMQALQPTIRNLVHKIPRISPHRRRPSTAQKDAEVASRPPTMDLFGPIPPMGEKLITVGGYIISLQQSARDNIHSMIKPRVSTDKDGLEVEIKIIGCHPQEIRFEKRYDTLIVIGVVNTPLPKSPLGLKSTSYKGEGVASQRREFLKSQGFIVPKINMHQSGPSTAIVPPGEHLDEIQEVVNIFVPKNISVNQVFISNPDAKGRIFVKGP